MTEITIGHIIQKIAQIYKLTVEQTVEQIVNHENNAISLCDCMQMLESIKKELKGLKDTKQDYAKLQQTLQHHEIEIRKLIGIEQTLTLYGDTLKVQVQQIEKQKMELLQNTKQYIKQLKKTNQQLFIQLSIQTAKLKGQHKSRNKSNNKMKTIENTSLAYIKKSEESSQQILKTQERSRSESGNKRKYKKRDKSIQFDTINQRQNQGIRAKAKTFQILNGELSRARNVIAASKKRRNKLLFSQLTLNPIHDLPKSNVKVQEKAMHQISKDRLKKQKLRFNAKSLARDANVRMFKGKRVNKSVCSIYSMQMLVNNHKQTL